MEGLLKTLWVWLCLTKIELLWKKTEASFLGDIFVQENLFLKIILLFGEHPQSLMQLKVHDWKYIHSSVKLGYIGQIKT